MPKKTRRIRIFSALEVANLCGVVNQTAINWIRNSYLKAFTTPGGQYRVYAEDLIEFLQGRGMRVPAELAESSRTDLDWNVLAVVDDDRPLNDLVKRFFEKAKSPFVIYQAYDGFEAGHILTERRPGFVILDVDLPGHDGYQICHRIKNDPNFGKPFVIAITGMDEDDTRERMLSAGADAFMPKPLDFDALSGLVETMAMKVRDGK